jgi:hypothetical protein
VSAHHLQPDCGQVMAWWHSYERWSEVFLVSGSISLWNCVASLLLALAEEDVSFFHSKKLQCHGASDCSPFSVYVSDKHPNFLPWCDRRILGLELGVCWPLDLVCKLGQKSWERKKREEDWNSFNLEELRCYYKMKPQYHSCGYPPKHNLHSLWIWLPIHYWLSPS